MYHYEADDRGSLSVFMNATASTQACRRLLHSELRRWPIMGVTSYEAEDALASSTMLAETFVLANVCTGEGERAHAIFIADRVELMLEANSHISHWD